jgi:ribosomal protein L11 methylase PrmA
MEKVNGIFSPSSFRDPKARIVLNGVQVFRVVSEEFSEEFKNVCNTGLLDNLVLNKKLVPFSNVPTEVCRSIDVINEGATVFELERLPFISYPYEWSFSALKAAALLQLELQISAIDVGIKLTDASAFNVQFVGPAPIFIDHTSFALYNEGEMWGAHQQFCSHFLNPLLLMSKFDVPFNEWWNGTLDGISASSLTSFMSGWDYLSPKLLTHVLLPTYFERKSIGKGVSNDLEKISKAKLPKLAARNMFQSLYNWIEKLSIKNSNTVWATYSSDNSYQDQEVQEKASFIAEFAQATLPNVLVDIGCNSGDYSKAALKGGAKTVIGLEADPVAVDCAFKRAVEGNLNFLPLYQNVVNPTTAKGWMGKEREGLSSRLNADAVIALAVIHHIVFSGHVPLDQALEWLIGIAPVGVIEFVPPDDPMIKRLLAFRKGDVHEYSYELFMFVLERSASVVKTKVVSKSKRMMVWYSRIN